MSAASMPRGARLRRFGGIGLRSLRARPLRSLLTTTGIVLGVGMAFGVLVLVSTIHSTFGNLFDTIYGRTSLVVSGESSIGSVPQATLPRIRRVEGVEGAAGTVYGIFRTVDDEGQVATDRARTLFVAGGDFDAPDTAGTEIVAGRDPVSPTAREIEVEEAWAAENGVEVGEVLRLSTPEGMVSLRVAAIFSFSGGLDLGGYGTAAMPADTVRELTGRFGVWDEITVIAADGVSTAELKRRIDAVTGPGVESATPAGKGDQANDQLASLDVVLYFFSGMALFVGAFLILNSFNMTVLQRVREIGTLRALGAPRLRIARSVAGEALILAAIGCLLGLALGLGMAELLAAAMRDLFGLPISALHVTPGSAFVAVALGLLATIAGALYPAARASGISPIRALTGDLGVQARPGVRRALVGLALFVPGLAIGGLYWFSNGSTGTGSVLVGVGSTMTMFVGMVLLAPFVVMPIIALLARPARALMPAEGRLATDSLRANPLRTAGTAAALVVTLSVVVVNTMMSSSFIGAIDDELDSRFARDLTVQPVGYTEYGPPGTGIAPSVERRIAALPQTGTVTPRRIVYMNELPGGEEPGLLVAVDPAKWPRVDASTYEGASTGQAMAGLAAGGVVLGKAYADNLSLEVGDSLPLAGASGAVRAPVVATLDTFEATGNQVLVSLATMKDVFGVETNSVLAATARSSKERDAFETEVNRLLGDDYPGYEAVSNQEFKEGYEDEINQQFAFFNAIIAIAVIVGLLGIVNTLSMSVIERTREIGVLRALGGSRWRIRRTMLDESLLISLGGSVAGITAGLLVGAVWILTVRESMDIDLALRVPTTMLIVITLLGVAIGSLAAIIPARRAAGLDPLQALTYE